jgi:hypothetical protein
VLTAEEETLVELLLDDETEPVPVRDTVDELLPLALPVELLDFVPVAVTVDERLADPLAEEELLLDTEGLSDALLEDEDDPDSETDALAELLLVTDQDFVPVEVRVCVEVSTKLFVAVPLITAD